MDRNRLSAGWGVVLACLSWAHADDLDRHMADLRPQLEDARVPLAERERLALELAANLDDAAKKARIPAVAALRWAEAASLLEGFTGKTPESQGARPLALQAGIYRWAQGEARCRELADHPADSRSRTAALSAFDHSLTMLRPLLLKPPEKPADPFLANVRYRLARTLADRAELDPASAASSRVEALAILEGPHPLADLAGHTHVLRASLATALGRLDLASSEWEAASKSIPTPSESELLGVRVDLLIARKRFEEALQAALTSKLDETRRQALALKVLLARRADLPEGPARRAVEVDLFEHAEALRGSGRPESHTALASLAAAVSQPDPQLGPEGRDTLAEGASLLGHPDRAGALAASAAEKAAALGHLPQAAALRFRASAFLFQAGSYSAADALLTQLAQDPQAGPIQPKAGLLRILTRERLLGKSVGKNPELAYREALETQVRDFPKDPSTQEARWRLGLIRLAAGDRAAAVRLWSALPAVSPHWLDARLRALDLLEADLDAQRLNGDAAASLRAMDEAQRFLDGATAEAGDSPDRAVLDLRRARLDLTPSVGRPEAALSACERALRTANRTDLAPLARRLRIAALAQLARTVDAETEARAEARRGSPADLLDLARLIDRAASASDADLPRRRAGTLIRTLIDPLSANPTTLPPAIRTEVTLRRIRALMLSGDPDSARVAMADTELNLGTLDDRQLADLASAAAQLGLPARASDAYRRLARRFPAGSLPWLSARFGLALAYSQSQKTREARQLIDGTAILHPDLGGADLRNRFEQLRERLAHEP